MASWLTRTSRARIFALVLWALMGIGAAGAAAASAPDPVPVTPPSAADELLSDLEARAFRFFWDTANPDNGLIPDRHPSPSFASIAAVGFALTAYPIGAERGYVTRAQARSRVLTTLRFLRRAPQGPAAHGMAGYRGFFYHFLDMKSGARFEDRELSTVDTALLIAGALFCQSYFDGAQADEVEIRALVDEIYGRVDWRWAQIRPPAIALGWKPESGHLPEDYRGYNEAMLLYILALGAPTHAVAPDAWEAWTSGYQGRWLTVYGQEHLHYPPLFVHQYPQIWIDFRGIQDAYMRGRGIDYFENSRRAVLAQRAYAIANPLHWAGYGENVWGLTACDGPADLSLDYRGEHRRFITYAGRGLARYDDGTIAPTAAVAAIPFAPEVAIPAVQEMARRYGQHLYSTYGFLDAFNPSFDYDLPLRHGRRVAGVGWFDSDYLGIDQGPIVAMLENYRSDLVWKTMRRNPQLRRGLERAGFSGGWLDRR